MRMGGEIRNERRKMEGKGREGKGREGKGEEKRRKGARQAGRPVFCGFGFGFQELCFSAGYRL